MSNFRTFANFSLRTQHFSSKHQMLGHMSTYIYIYIYILSRPGTAVMVPSHGNLLTSGLKSPDARSGTRLRVFNKQPHSPCVERKDLVERQFCFLGLGRRQHTCVLPCVPVEHLFATLTPTFRSTAAPAMCRTDRHENVVQEVCR